GNLVIRPETPASIKDVPSLRKELRKIREQGYSLIDEELQPNVQGVAAPVSDGSGQVIAAIAFTTQKSVSPVQQSEIDQLLQCTKKVSAELS
ncbi:MAG: IclR family transcriptional regulator C-terminal domain-containing protein, partial [Bulleidia sp.]